MTMSKKYAFGSAVALASKALLIGAPLGRERAGSMSPLLAAPYGAGSRFNHTPKVRPAGEAQREADRHNLALNPGTRRTVGQFMLRYEPELKAKLRVSRFNRQNNNEPRASHTYRAARRAGAKWLRSAPRVKAEV